MSTDVERDQALPQDALSAEEAEGLLEWILERPSVKVDLSSLRPACAAGPPVMRSGQPRKCARPQDAELREWLESALKPAP